MFVKCVFNRLMESEIKSRVGKAHFIPGAIYDLVHTTHSSLQSNPIKFINFHLSISIVCCLFFLFLVLFI